MDLKAIDLFSGIGGIRLGFEQAFGKSIKFIYANEIDDYACKTYESNFGMNPKGDITKTDIQNIPYADLLVAGFPCQPFSIAGHKLGFNDTRGDMFFYILNILSIQKPEAFMLENVKYLEHHNGGKTFRRMIESLNCIGYKVKYAVLNSKDFGVPQNRKRIYIVGFKRDEIINDFRFPEPEKQNSKIRDILEKDVPEQFYLSSKYLKTLRNHKQRHADKNHGFGYEILDTNGISNTIVCGGMGIEKNLIVDMKPISDPMKNDEGIRKMTPREWARLQGFPDSFVFPVSMTRSYKQIANSVSVPVIKLIALRMGMAIMNYYGPDFD